MSVQMKPTRSAGVVEASHADGVTTSYVTVYVRSRLGDLDLYGWACYCGARSRAAGNSDLDAVRRSARAHAALRRQARA